jgi:hypothetical protein
LEFCETIRISTDFGGFRGLWVTIFGSLRNPGEYAQLRNKANTVSIASGVSKFAWWPGRRLAGRGQLVAGNRSQSCQECEDRPEATKTDGLTRTTDPPLLQFGCLNPLSVVSSRHSICFTSE